MTEDEDEQSCQFFFCSSWTLQQNETLSEANDTPDHYIVVVNSMFIITFIKMNNYNFGNLKLCFQIDQFHVCLFSFAFATDGRGCVVSANTSLIKKCTVQVCECKFALCDLPVRKDVRTKKVYTGSMRITNQVFLDAYENSNSSEFKALAKQVTTQVKLSLRPLPLCSFFSVETYSCVNHYLFVLWIDL